MVAVVVLPLLYDVLVPVQIEVRILKVYHDG